jgi:hypothetical protein
MKLLGSLSRVTKIEVTLTINFVMLWYGILMRSIIVGDPRMLRADEKLDIQKRI